MGCGQGLRTLTGHVQKEDWGRLGCGPAGTHSDSSVPAKPPPRARGMGMEAAGVPRWPQCHPPCHWISPSPRHVCEARGQEGWARPAPSLTRRLGAGAEAEEAGLLGTDRPPPPPAKLCCSRYRLAPSLSQASQRKQNTTESKNKHGKTDTRSDTHRSKVTRSTST